MSDSYTLIYDGSLSPQTVSYLRSSMNDGYTFWAELSYYPDNFHVWSESALDKRYMVQGNDIEGYSSGWRTSFCLVRRSFLLNDDSVVFCGFRTEHERDACAEYFSDIVVSVNPFKTGF